MRILSLTVLNAHLAGQTGRVAGRDTGLTLDDEERAAGLTRILAESSDDVVGLIEVWDQRLGQGILSGVRGNFPYSVYAPSADGISDILSYLQANVLKPYVSWIWPKSFDYLVNKTERIVNGFSQNHYKVGSRTLLSALRVFPEDWIFSSLSRAMNEPLFWGAGMLILSRHPIESASFTPFDARADLERFTGKGILRATIRPIRPEDTEPVDVFLTHYQEGTSRHAREARRRQILQTRELVLQSAYATAVMGDMNIDEDTPEYREMKAAFRMKDAYRTAHPDRRAEPGYTFDYNNRFTKKQLGKKWGVRRDGQAAKQRIDYIWLNHRLQVLKAEVVRFMAANGVFISDHDAMRVAVALAA